MPTFNELINDTLEILNLSSDEAKSRVSQRMNTVYRQVTSGIGLVPSRRVRLSVTVPANEKTVTIEDVEKVNTVYRTEVSPRQRILKEITPDAMLVEQVRDSNPTKFAIRNISPNSVTLELNAVSATPYDLNVDALQNLVSLSLTGAPTFPESYHDVLIHGVLSYEYKKMEKEGLAAQAAADFEQRFGDLKMFIAKSAFLDLFQGKNRERVGWWETTRGGIV